MLSSTDRQCYRPVKTRGMRLGHAFPKHVQPPSGFVSPSVIQFAGFVSPSVKQFESKVVSNDGLDEKEPSPEKPVRIAQETVPKPTSSSVRSKRSKSLRKPFSASAASSTQLSGGKDEKGRVKSSSSHEHPATWLHISSLIESFRGNSFDEWTEEASFVRHHRNDTTESFQLRAHELCYFNICITRGHYFQLVK